MKKSLLTLLGAGLLLTSCQSDEPFAPVEGGEKQVTFTLNVPGELGTRAGNENYNSGVGGWTNTQGNVSYTLVLSAEGHNQTYKKENVAGNTVTFSPTVVLGREYTVTAYAHFKATAQENLESITETKGINEESKDVYFFTTKENVSEPTINFAEGTSYNFDLKRPYAKLRLIATDYKAVGNGNTAIKSVKVNYNNNVFTTFNAVRGEFSNPQPCEYTLNETNNYSTSYYAPEVDENGNVTGQTIFADYIPVNETGVAPFTITVEYTNGEKYTREFNQDIPVRRNALTTLKGNFFTAGAEIKVEVKDAFEGQIPGNAEEQLRMVAAMGGEVTLTDNVELDAPLNVQANMTLNLGGYTITTTLEEEGRHHYAILNNANLVIEGEGAINARGIKNFGEMTVNGNVTIKNIDSNGGAAIWNEGKVTINNGTFISSEGAGADTYGAALNTRASGEAVVNGGTFEAYSQLTYAIVNEGKMTINDAAVKGKHGAVAGAESNDQTTINGGSFELMGVSGQSDHCAYFVSNIRGGVFSRNEADTSAGDSVFYNSTIAVGYKAIEKDGKYYVVPAEAVAVTTATELTTALGKGLSVVLVEDIDMGSTQLAITGKNQVVDLGGHELTTANNWGGISLKNGACIKNGTITHAGNTAAIKAFNGSSVENVTITTCSTADKEVTGIAVQQGANVEYIKNVTINGVSQGIEVGYQATVGLIENAVVNESNNGTAKGIGLKINGGKVGKAKDCTFKGETYGITLHLKGVFAAGLELENCTVEGTTASIYAWDEKGISNTSGSLILTYDAATTLNGPFVWDFEDECQSVVTLNLPQ